MTNGEEVMAVLGQAVSALRAAERELRAHGESWREVRDALERGSGLLERYYAKP